MKICIINNIFHPYSRGGADKIAKLMADGFLQNNDEVFIIATKPRNNQLKSGEYQGYYLSSLFDDLKNIPLIFRLSWHVFDMFNCINYFKVRNILKIEKPDLVISHNLKGLGYLIPMAISRLKIKHIHILHDIQLIYPSGLINYGEEEKLNTIFCKLYYQVTSILFNKTNVVISPSKWLLGFHRERKLFKNSDTYIIPNPINLSINSATSEIAKIPNIIFVGELEEHKGVKLLVDAVKELNREKIVCKLDFYGAGSYESILKNESRSGYIKYGGKLDNKEIIKKINSAHALIVPSLCYENSPTVIYEASSQKIPVIASRIGGITELVHEFGGVLFNPGDIKDLIKKINYLILNYPKIKAKSEISAKILSEYSIEKYIEKIKKIINKKSHSN